MPNLLECQDNRKAALVLGTHQIERGPLFVEGLGEEKLDAAQSLMNSSFTKRLPYLLV